MGRQKWKQKFLYEREWIIKLISKDSLKMIPDFPIERCSKFLLYKKLSRNVAVLYLWSNYLFIFSTDAWQQYTTVLKTSLLHRNFVKEFDHRYRAVISQNAFWWLKKYFWRTLANGCFSKRADKIGSFL